MLHRSWPMAVLFFGTAVYGGYFGAGMGIIMIALLAIFVPDDLQRLNGLKNVLAALINGVAGILFVAVAPVHIGLQLENVSAERGLYGIDFDFGTVRTDRRPGMRAGS